MSTASTYRLATVVFLAVLAASSLVSESVHAQVNRGQALYENHCLVCHETNVHLRETHKAQSIDEVRGWVASWAAHGKLEWNRDDIEDVTRYLSRHLYHFEQ